MSDMTIKLTKTTIDVLKKINEINQGVRIVQGDQTLKVKTTDNTILVHAPIDIEFPRDVYIYDVREFLAVNGIIENGSIDLSTNQFCLFSSDDGKQKIRYIEGDPEFINSHTDKEPSLGDIDLNLEVSEEQFTTVLKAAHTLNLDYIGFISDGETVSLTTFNKNNGDESLTNKYSIDLAECDETFEMFYKLSVQNISVLEGEGNLKFELTKKKVSRITTESGKTFWIVMNTGSSWK